MRSWQHTATFLAFALVAGVIVFAGTHSSVAPRGDGILASAAK
jgi:hypothetical protein